MKLVRAYLLWRFRATLEFAVLLVMASLSGLPWQALAALGLLFLYLLRFVK